MSLSTVSDRSIEAWLWDAANILRGPVDASDFKAYVFPLLFLKRISDVYDEERSEALADSDGDKEYADPPRTASLSDPRGLPLVGCACHEYCVSEATSGASA